jgi:hypothetical protein
MLGWEVKRGLEIQRKDTFAGRADSTGQAGGKKVWYLVQKAASLARAITTF